jgi:hypothetical protein
MTNLGPIGIAAENWVKAHWKSLVTSHGATFVLGWTLHALGLLPL